MTIETGEKIRSFSRSKGKGAGQNMGQAFLRGYHTLQSLKLKSFQRSSEEDS
jgi:hypothetical protein